MAKHIVTGIKPYDFIDDSGQRRAGIKVYYFDDEPEVEGARGYFPLNLSAPIEEAKKFESIPGLYDLDFKQRADKQGRPVLTLRSVEFIQSIDFKAV